MKINKQLFEDVLSGKLKGIFVLRNGDKVLSPKVDYTIDYTFPIYLDGCSYTYRGCFDLLPRKHLLDIIDFIPDMKENELTIEIPDGKIVDWEESKKQNKIVLKDKQLTYEEICDKLPGMIDIPLFDTPSEDGNALVANEHQLECLLAKNKLANVAKYLNDGWDVNPYSFGYIIINGGFTKFKIEYTAAYSIESSSRIVFKSEELAQQAIEILGEETIKLALEPLGI